MLSGRKCQVTNPHYGKDTCPPGFEHLEIFEALIVDGPRVDDSKIPFNYAILVVTNEGRLFGTSHQNIRLTDYTLPPF